MDADKLLLVIPSTEPATLYEVVGQLGDDKPLRGQNKEWWELFEAIESLEAAGFVEVERDGRRIESLKLTEAGAYEARQLQATARA